LPKYAYTAKDASGKSVKDVMDAPSQQTVVDRLQKKEMFVISIKELSFVSPAARRAQAKKKKGKRFTHKKVKMQDMIIFARQLATMLEAGVSMIRSLDVICTQIQSQIFFNTLKQVRNDVEQGGGLSNALAKHTKVFNQFWTSLVEVGEASGTIPVVLYKLTFYLEQQAKFKSTIISGMIYPLILFCVSMGAVGFFALFVGPRFESIFEAMNVDLPIITVVLLAVFGFIKKNFLLLVGGTVLTVFLFRQYLNTYNGRMRYEKFLFGMPKVGEVYRSIIVERFCSQMSILIDAGVPILYALDITERLVDNHTCAIIVGDIKEAVREGVLLADPMEKSAFFPAMAIQMIQVGEETGELSKMLKHVSTFYQEQVEIFMSRFATIVEPFMLVFMGAVIGTIVLAMFLPMFNIAQLGGAGTGT